MNNDPVIIYTDGACSGNPGPGGWSAILKWNDHTKELSGGEKHTTNNRMELKGPIMGLSALKVPSRVHIYTDSAYVYNCFKQKWYQKWEKNGWMTQQKTPVENRDLWEELLALVRKHDVKWFKVKGHSGDSLNERADELATSAIKY